MTSEVWTKETLQLLPGIVSGHVRSLITLGPPCWGQHIEALRLTVPAETNCLVILAQAQDTRVENHQPSQAFRWLQS